MKIGVKDFKKAYKNVNIDQIEVSTVHFSPSASFPVNMPLSSKNVLTISHLPLIHHETSWSQFPFQVCGR